MHALTSLGWDEGVGALFEEATAGRADVEPGRVTRVERAPKSAGFTATAIVATAAGDAVATATSVFPAVGDWVVVRHAGGGLSLVEAIVPRTSVLTRQDPGSEHTEQVLAANVDVVVIAVPLDRLRMARVERELLVAWESGATPIVALTKADAVPDAAALEREVDQRVEGVRVIRTSARSGEGIDALRTVLHPNRTAVLFGPSGAGKSTLANALLGEEVLATGEVREADRRGRHTTTSRQLVVLPSGGVLIDTPGIRSLGVWGGGSGLAAAFADVATAESECRFADCMHAGEPGCAVVAAVEAGVLDAARVENYRKLRSEVEARPATARRSRRRRA